VARGTVPGAGAEIAQQIDDLILEHDPDEPGAVRHAVVRRMLEDLPSTRPAARALCAAAPQRGKSHLLLYGEDLDVDEELRHQAIAASLLPENPSALHNYAAALLRAGRPEESRRAAARALALAPRYVSAHNDIVRALRAAERPGAAFAAAEASWRVLGALWEQKQLSESDGASIRRAQHLFAGCHLDVGRLDDAVATAQRALATGESRSARAELDTWLSEPNVLAAAYARDGHSRREPGRVLDGMARGRPLAGHDVAIVIDALVAAGKEELAPLAYAHHEAAGRTTSPAAWLAGAQAALLGGDARRALELWQRASLGGAALVDPALNRVLRLAATLPAAEWEEALALLHDAGAVTLARLAARDVADFVPGLDASEVVADALGPRVGRAFDPTWLAPLARALGIATDAIDAFFAAAEPTLAGADRLAAGWVAHAAGPAEAAWVFAQALCRYLALTTGAPNPLAGGLRQVATEALTVVADAPPLQLGALRSILEAIDAAGDGVDPWILDRWLLRFERAVGLEGRVGGGLAMFATGLGRVAEHLRGEERVAFELRLAHELKDDDDPTNDDQARVLFERSLRAVGTGPVAVGWTEVTSGLPPAATLDVLFTCAAAEPRRRGAPHLLLARALLAAGRAERALDALCVGLPLLDAAAREQRLAELRPHLERADVGIPFDWAAAQDAGLAHLRAGRPLDAMRCFRWCNAIDPNNAGMLKNLGLACAAVGRVAATVAAFSEMDEGDGPRLAGHALLQANRYRDAVQVLRYASIYFADSADWETLAGAAWYDEDDETAADAYERVYRQKRGGLGAAELSTFAAALYGAGRFERCEEIARELIAVGFDDPTLLAHGNHAMARALLGQGRAVEAIPFAQLALKSQPLDAAAAEFAETLARAQRGEPYPQKPLRGAGARARAFAAVTAGDMKAASSIASSDPGWGTARAALAAVALRTDAAVAVPEAALRLIAANLDGCAGALDRDATLWRLTALALRADAFFPIDPPPPLGARMAKDELDRQLAERLEEDEPTIMKELANAPTVREPIPARLDDLELFPGTQIPRLSDYVQVMKAMQGHDPLGALARLGIDMAAYARLASRWAQRLAADPDLSARFSREMDS
jgi:tetratricopeptide (TPR) repeat protein